MQTAGKIGKSRSTRLDGTSDSITSGTRNHHAAASIGRSESSLRDRIAKSAATAKNEAGAMRAKKWGT